MRTSSIWPWKSWETEALRAIAAGDPRPELRELAADRARLLEAFRKRPGMAAGLGLLCPGCGYFYLRRPGRALAYVGPTLALLVAAGVALDGEELRLSGPGPRQEPSAAPLALPLVAAATNLWGYGIFAAYRDARLARGDVEGGYQYPISPESLGDLVSAPFRPQVLSRPWFWAGLPAMLGAAVGLSVLVEPESFGRNTRTLGEGGGVWFLGRRYRKPTGILLGESYHAGLFLPVSVGEEAVFRGMLQPALSEGLGLWPGWVATSLLFGALHVFNFTSGTDQELKTAALATPFITGVGSYLGLVAIKTGFRLETSVALHFWYDFLLGTISFIADPDHQPFAVRIGLPF